MCTDVYTHIHTRTRARPSVPGGFTSKQENINLRHNLLFLCSVFAGHLTHAYKIALIRTYPLERILRRVDKVGEGEIVLFQVC